MDNAAPSGADRYRGSLREAACWHLLSLLFAPPRDDWPGILPPLADEMDDADLAQAAHLAVRQADVGWYHSTFGPGGPVSLREVAYRRTIMPATILAELQACYEAFAYRPQIAEPPDHIAVESGFVAFLWLKHAYAMALDDTERAELARRIAQRFVAEHIAPMAQALASLLAGSAVDYLVSASAWLARRAGYPQADIVAPRPPASA